MEDIAAVLINSFSISLHNSFLIEASKARVAVILCEKFKPVSLMLPVQRATDTLLTRAQITAPKKLLQELWLKTVHAKCLNQYAFCEFALPTSLVLSAFQFALRMNNIRKEGICARHYWQIYSTSLQLNQFTRDRNEDGLNSLLNYGYAVLLIRVLQRLLAFGLDPMYGIGHAVRERATPLAYDLMEPFRIVVDAAVWKWCKEKQTENAPLLVDKSYKTFIHQVMEEKIAYETLASQRASVVLDTVVKSFRSALTEKSIKAYKPWIRRNSKWDGSLSALTSR